VPLYESIMIVRQDVTAAQVDALADGFSEILTNNGGSIERREYWGLRTLAYRIKKNRKGHYVLLNIDAPSDAILEMERNMRLSEDVVRYLTVRVKDLEADQSIVLRSRGSRDDRGRGGRRFGGPDRGGPRGPREDSRGPREESRAPRKPEPEAAKAEGAAAEKEGGTE